MGRQNNADLKDVWQTPDSILSMLGPLDLDPCAGEDTHIAQTNYTKDDDGLSKDWHGRVFVNPPFSQKELWLEKAIEERDNTDVIFVVTPDSTDTKSWWHEYIAAEADYIWFSEGRISYIDPDSGDKMGSPTFGTAISVFGEPDQRVLRRMDEQGQLLETVSFQ